VVGGERGRFGNFLDSNHGEVDKILYHRVGVGVLMKHLGRTAFMESDKQRTCLTKLGLEYSEIALNGLKSRVVNFRRLVMHGDKVIVVLSDFLIFGLISSLKGEFFKQIFQPNRVGDVFGS
jgi:hypothetical protein